MERLKTLGPLAIALGLAYLGTAILYLAIEASALRKQMPLVLAAIEGVEGGGEPHPMLVRIDAAVVELARANDEVEALRKQIPEVLTESAAIRAIVPEILAEVKEVCAAIVPVLEESAAFRQELPGIIEDVGIVVKQAKGVSKSVGKGAAQGAVEGTVKGIVAAPFEVLKQGADLLTPSGDDKGKAEDAGEDASEDGGEEEPDSPQEE